MITIEVKGPVGCGKTHFINEVLLPALEGKNVIFAPASPKYIRGRKPDYCVIEVTT